MKLCRSALFALAVLAIGCSPEKKEEPKFEPVKVSEEKAPASFRARFDTSQGVFVIEVKREWAHDGADRFYQLVQTGYFNDARFYRVMKNYVAQWGINKDPKVSQMWSELKMPDDPVTESNRRGYVSFAKSGPATRTTQVFINLTDNHRQLDSSGFAPFGQVIGDGMDVVSKLYSGYGDLAPRGGGPDQNRIMSEGNEYLQRQFPRLDYIKTATIEK